MCYNINCNIYFPKTIRYNYFKEVILWTSYSAKVVSIFNNIISKSAKNIIGYTADIVFIRILNIENPIPRLCSLHKKRRFKLNLLCSYLAKFCFSSSFLTSCEIS